jgi:hypothetical protein
MNDTIRLLQKLFFVIQSMHENASHTYLYSKKKQSVSLEVLSLLCSTINAVVVLSVILFSDRACVSYSKVRTSQKFFDILIHDTSIFSLQTVHQ